MMRGIAIVALSLSLGACAAGVKADGTEERRQDSLELQGGVGAPDLPDRPDVPDADGGAGPAQDEPAPAPDLQERRLRFYEVAPEFEERLRGMDLDVAMGELQRSVTAGRESEGVLLLLQFLRMHPEAAADVARRCDALPPSRDNAIFTGFAYAAIGSAGHTEAQQVLADVMSDRSYNGTSRDRAMRGALSVELPERFLLDAVWTYRETWPRTGNNWQILLSLATNVYGALGAARHGVPAHTAEAVATLGRRLDETGDTMERRLMLVALGNVGDLDRVLPLTAPFFDSAEPSLRRAAFNTFHATPGERAFAEFARRYDREADPQIRRAAAVIAERMPASDGRRRWAADKVLSSPDPQVRQRLVRIVGDGLAKHPDDEEILRDVLVRERNRKVRRQVYAYISHGGRRR